MTAWNEKTAGKSQEEVSGRQDRSTIVIAPGHKCATRHAADHSRKLRVSGLAQRTSRLELGARERLTNSHNYVIVTVRPDGRPHAMGMHGLWHDDAYYFGTSSATRKAKNLALNPHCVLISEDMNELIIAEGVAEIVDLDDLPQGIPDATRKKYGWPLKPHSGGKIYKLSPHVVFALPAAADNHCRDEVGLRVSLVPAPNIALQLPRPDAQHRLGCNAKAVIGMNVVHAAHPGVGVLNVDQPPCEGACDDDVYTASAARLGPLLATSVDQSMQFG